MTAEDLRPTNRSGDRLTPQVSVRVLADAWSGPAIVTEVRHLATKRGLLGHAVFVKFRPDKLWTECSAA
jgi:ATP-dependent DNA ligase